MSFLDLYEGDQAQAAQMQPGEGTRLPSTFEENFHAAWSDGRLFGQSVASFNARADALSDYADEVRRTTGADITEQLYPEGGYGVAMPDYDAVNAKVAALKEKNPALAVPPLSDAEVDRRAVAKAQAAHRTYQTFQEGEKGPGGSLGTFFGSAASSATDPINIVGLAVAPEAAGIGILSTALRWGAIAGVSQAAIEGASNQFKEQVQPGYTESGEPVSNVAGAFVSGAVLGGVTKTLGNAWTRVKTGAWPTSVRDAGNVIESEANIAGTNPFKTQPPQPTMSDAEIAAAVSGQPTAEAQATMRAKLLADREASARQQQAEITSAMSMQPFGAEAEVSHREALAKAIDDILAGRPVDVSQQISPELLQAAREARQLKPATDLTPTTEMKQAELPLETGEPVAAPRAPEEAGPPAPLQTPEEMVKTLTAPDHQEAIRADIDRARAMGDVQVPGIDENGNHTMIGVDNAMDEVDAYKAAAEQIQACANPVQEETQTMPMARKVTERGRSGRPMATESIGQPPDVEGGALGKYRQALAEGRITQAEFEGFQQALQPQPDAAIPAAMGGQQRYISDIIKDTGLPREDVHAWLLDQAKQGNVTIHPSTLHGTPPEIMSGAMHLPGFNEPFISAYLKPKAP